MTHIYIYEMRRGIMIHLYKHLKDEALHLIEQKSTADDIKAENDLRAIDNAFQLVQSSIDYFTYARGLDAKLYSEYPEIQGLCTAASMMQTTSPFQGIGTKSELEQIQDALITDYFGILASVLIKHRKIQLVKEFIESTD